MGLRWLHLFWPLSWGPVRLNFDTEAKWPWNSDREQQNSDKRHKDGLKMRQRQRIAQLLMVISFDTTKCPPVFIKWTACDKRSPTSLNCGQIVEDKTAEYKRVIPLRSCELSKPLQIMAIKTSYLSLMFSCNQCFYDHKITLTGITVTRKTLFTRTKVGAKRVLAVCVDVTNWWRLQALIFI